MMKPGDFRQHLQSGTADYELLIREYSELWVTMKRLNQQIDHLQEGSTAVLLQKRSYHDALRDFVQDLRATGRIEAPTIIRHLDLIKGLV